MGELKKKDADKRMVEQATHKFLADEQERLATLHAKHRMMKDDAVKQIKIYRSGVNVNQCCISSGFKLTP